MTISPVGGVHCNICVIFSDIFKRLFNFGSLFYSVAMATSKYSKFCYASMCGNI